MKCSVGTKNKEEEVTLPLIVFLAVISVSEKWGSHDAEGEHEAHGKAEEGERADAVGQDHRVGVQGTTFLLVNSA